MAARDRPGAAATAGSASDLASICVARVAIAAPPKREAAINHPAIARTGSLRLVALSHVATDASGLRNALFFLGSGG